MTNWNDAAFLLSSALADQLPPSISAEVAFSGRSNVGKSSLINRLTGRKSLARTSSTPGKTATVNFYRVGDARLVDLPGYGYAKVSDAEKRRWASLIDGYFQDDRDLRLVIQLLDIRHDPSRDDEQMLTYLTEREIPFVVVLTKADKLNKTERASRMAAWQAYFDERYEGLTFIPFSASSGEGTEPIRAVLQSVFE